MTTEQTKLLGVFEDRIHQIIGLCDELKDKNGALKTQLTDAQQSFDDLKLQYEALKDKYDNLKMARIISVRKDDLKTAKEKVSKLVREVDNCIALLNG